MDFSDIKKWHLAIVLPIFTGVLTFSYLSLEPQANARTTSPMMFQQALVSKPVGKENPVPRVQNIRIYPPIDGLYTVNFDQLVEDRQNDRWLKQQWSFTAKSPNPGESQSILDWMRQLQKNDPERIGFTYEWWREPSKLTTIWGIFSGILMLWGIVIPTTIWFAKGGAREFIAKPKRSAEDTAAAAKPAVSAAEHDKLTAMIGRLEDSNPSVGKPRTAGAAVGPGTVPAEAVPFSRNLTGAPLEAAQTNAAPEEDKDYKGEFYPVARPNTKKE